MFVNPFTPVFGGKPEFFFGRRDILMRFDRAMIDRGSEDRALFITGTRGSGKTALLEQLSQRAKTRGRTTIDLSSENTIEILVRSLVEHHEETRTISPEASVSILGTGIGIGAGSISKTTRYTASDLQMVFLNACDKLPGGLLVTVDEVQKVPESDLTALCDAFQMASRKGRDVMLSVAGLPFAHSQIIQYQGCTYLRRAAHDEIGLFSRDEARSAFAGGLARIDGLEIEDEAFNALVDASFGHPYLMQLMGYYLVLSCNEHSHENHCRVGLRDVRSVIADANDSYEKRALAPMMDELTHAEREFLTAMSKAMGERPTVRTAAIAEAMGKSASSIGRLRESLLRLGIISVPEYGSLMFAIPLLRHYVLKKPSAKRNIERALDWGV